MPLLMGLCLLLYHGPKLLQRLHHSENAVYLRHEIYTRSQEQGTTWSLFQVTKTRTIVTYCEAVYQNYG
eukprot:m.11766 g.11766  ORF g.11766 m.11766 type:complete len:69 (+) comp5767_c0_seq1:979-1185(+)